jgi:hypothetical protein
MAIKLTPPPGCAPFKQIPLASGIVLLKFSSDDRAYVTVQSESDALELEAEGWVREPPKMAKHAPIFGNAQRRANLEALAKHNPGLAKQCADLLDALEDLIERTDTVSKRIGAIPIDPPYVLRNDSIANGAQHRSVRGIHEPAERTFE